MPFVQESKELVEPAPKRMIIRVTAQVPFADECRRVADAVQLLGERAFRFGQTGSRGLRYSPRSG